MQADRTARFQYEAAGLTFVWHGGEYIDVGTVQDIAGQSGMHGDDFHAFDCINVWDHATDTPRIPRTLEAFKARCREYLSDQDEA